MAVGDGDQAEMPGGRRLRDLMHASAIRDTDSKYQTHHISALWIVRGG